MDYVGHSGQFIDVFYTEAIKKSPLASSEIEVEKAIQAFFKNACDRRGGSAVRKNKKAAQLSHSVQNGEFYETGNKRRRLVSDTDSD